MAPRRSSGGGYSSGYGSSTCPGAFADMASQVSFAYTVVYFVIFVGISIAMCVMRKKSGAGKKLIGGLYIPALLLMILSNLLGLISTVLIECNTAGVNSYVSMSIASNIFYGLSVWALLFVIVYNLNTMLREQLGGVNMLYRVVPLAIVGVMFVLICASMGLQSYINSTQFGDSDDYYNARDLIPAQQKLALARIILYFLSVIASAALSLMAIFAMRSRSLPGGDLIGWVAALYICMLIWTAISIVFASQYFRNEIYEWESSIAMSYVLSFFQALSFIILLCIGKHVAWNKSTTTTQPAYAPVMQQQTGYGYNNAYGQSDYYQQAPVYVQPR